MPGRCGSSSWTSEAALRKRPVSGRAPHAGYTPWEARSITPELIRSVGCAPDQGCPRLAEAAAIVEPHLMADDLGGKAMVFVTLGGG
jgi:hypothetical protein